MFLLVDNSVNSLVVIVRPLSLPPEEGGASTVLGGVAGIILPEITLSYNNSYYLLDDGGYIVGLNAGAPFVLNETSSFHHLPLCLYNVLINNSFYTPHNVTGYYVKPCSSSEALSTGSSPATRLTVRRYMYIHAIHVHAIHVHTIHVHVYLYTHSSSMGTYFH